MKQTAVEWLIDKYIIVGGITKTMVKQAKAMEKEQIMDAFDEGKSDGYKTAREWDEMVTFLNAEQYYNETFKSE